MNHLSRWVPEIALGAPALALLGLLVIPWGERRAAGLAGEVVTPSPVVATEPAGVAGRTASPRELAGLFGWRGAAAAPAPAPASPQVQEASWIQAMGYVVEQNETRSYLFKDTRTRMVLSLKPGAAAKGWRLLEVRERDFLLEFEGQPYIIKRKP
jgi:uncharacterized protein YdeI (BOF family)